MPVPPMIKPTTFFKNGLGSFTQPCHEIILRYCNYGGSSRGMREFIRQDLAKIAQKNPSIKFTLKREPGHPLVEGRYGSGLSKPICVRNYDAAKISEKITVAKNASGQRLTKFTQAVRSDNPSVRGIWSPFHVEKKYRFRV